MAIQPRITTTTTTTITTISEIGNNDVLCGRSKECFNNIGNRRFRVLINLNLNRYLACKKKSYDRSTMIHTLTEEICESIRFFKHMKKGNSATSTTSSVLIELSRDQSREKISHALRDAASQQIKIKNKNKGKSKITVMIKAPMPKKHQTTPLLTQRIPITNIHNDDQKIQDNNSNNPPIITNTCPLSRRRLSMYVFQEEIHDYEVEQVTSNSDCMPLMRLSDIFNNSQGERNDDENINNSNNNNNHQHHSNRPQILCKEKRTSCNYGFTFVFDDDDDENININSNNSNNNNNYHHQSNQSQFSYKKRRSISFSNGFTTVFDNDGNDDDDAYEHININSSNNNHQYESNQLYFSDKERRTSCSSFLSFEPTNDFSTVFAVCQ